jgi:hypothetical protein
VSRRAGGYVVTAEPVGRVEPVGFAVSPLMLGMGALVVALVAGLLFGTPWGRGQLALSTTRLPQSYWELYLQDPAKAATCAAPGSTARVVVAMRNRADRSVQVVWQALVVRPDLASTVAASGKPDLAAGQTRLVTISYRVPAGSYTLDVHDDSQTHRLLVNCPRTVP